MSIVSSPELIRALLLADRDVSALARGGVFIGPTTIQAAELGSVSLFELPGTPEQRSRVVRPQMEASCVHSSVADASELGQAVYLALNAKGRRIVTQPSTGQKYLVHLTFASTPVLRQGELEGTWDVAVQIQTMIGTDPIP